MKNIIVVIVSVMVAGCGIFGKDDELEPLKIGRAHV